MPDLRPFRGIRYSASEDLKDLVCPPYDIISEGEQHSLHERHPNNAVRLELARGGEGEERYRQAAAAYEGWLGSGVLVQDEDDLFYVYRQDFEVDGTRRRVVGVIGALGLEPFGASSGVLPHERTMEGPKKDRLALLRALPVNVSPIYGIYRGSGELVPYYDSLEHRPPQARLVDEQGILHRLWVVTAPAEIEMLRRAVADGPLVIADGHHRYETALAFHNEQSGDGPHDAVMCFCVDADAEDLVVLPYNRALRLREGTDPQSALSAHGGRGIGNGDPEKELAGAGRDMHPFVFVLPDGYVAISVSDEEVVAAVGERAEAWRALDVVALHEALLPRLFGDALEELTFTKDPAEVVRLVREEGWDGGVLLRALRAPQIVDVARSGERMPQKASYFWPKAVTGLVFRSLR